MAHRVEPARVADAPEGQQVGNFGDVDLFGLYVREEDAEPVRKLDAVIAIQLLPDEAPHEVEGEEACPACGTELQEEIDECPECGIAFA